MTSRQVQLIDILYLPTLLLTLDHKSLYQIITEARHLSLLGQLKTACELDGIWDELRYLCSSNYYQDSIASRSKKKL